MAHIQDPSNSVRILPLSCRETLAGNVMLITHSGSIKQRTRNPNAGVIAYEKPYCGADGTHPRYRRDQIRHQRSSLTKYHILAETWPFRFSSSSKKRLPKSLFAKTLLIIVQRAQDDGCSDLVLMYMEKVETCLSSEKNQPSEPQKRVLASP